MVKKGMPICNIDSSMISGLSSKNTSIVDSKTVSMRHSQKLKKSQYKQNTDLLEHLETTVHGTSIKQLDQSQWESMGNILKKPALMERGTQNVSQASDVSSAIDQRAAFNIDITSALLPPDEPQTAIYKEVVDLNLHID